MKKESNKRNVVLLMDMLEVIPSNQAVDRAFDTTWRVGRGIGKVEIEVHLFLKSLGRNAIAFDS